MLEVKNLKKSYGTNRVLDNISFKVEKGDRVAIIGHSGCGKSTLLRCLNMLEKPDGGQIIFEDLDITGKNVNLSKIRAKISMVFQQFNLFPHLTVLKNIVLAPVELGKMSKEEAIEEATKLLKVIGLYDKKENYPSQLSGGEQQRVAIVRALMMNPDIILFDEATSALDPGMVKEVLELIKKIADEGMTMILVSHEINFVKNCANKILFIDDKKVAFYGTMDEALKSDNKKLRSFLDSTSK